MPNNQSTSLSKEEKDKLLISILYKFAEGQVSDNDYQSILNDFKLIYDEGDQYRHSYSKITQALLEKKDFNDVIGNLPENFGWFISNYVAQLSNISPKLLAKINKLYDHVNLEYVRVNYIFYLNESIGVKQSEGLVRKIEQYWEQLNLLDKEKERLNLELNNQRKDWKQEIDKQKSDLKRAFREIYNQRTQYITILGIFASIVFTVFSGISFTTSVFSSISQVNIFKLSYFCCLSGVIIFSIIIGLCWFIAIVSNIKIHNKLIYWFIAIVYASFAFGIYYFFDRSLSYF